MTALLVAATIAVAGVGGVAVLFLLYADAFREQAEDEDRRIPGWVRSLFDFLRLRRRERRPRR